MSTTIDATEIRSLLERVGDLLAAWGEEAEIMLAGGAAMALLLHSRASTRDVDAVFISNREAILRASHLVAQETNLPASWLNDAVREYIHGDAPRELVFSHGGLIVLSVTLDYLFYLKANAHRDDVDEQDVREIAAAIGVSTFLEALETMDRHARGATIERDTQIWLEAIFG